MPERDIVEHDGHDLSSKFADADAVAVAVAAVCCTIAKLCSKSHAKAMAVRCRSLAYLKCMVIKQPLPFDLISFAQTLHS